jgi:hypothetical protein
MNPHPISAVNSPGACPCSDHHGEGPTIGDLPLPHALREEWLRLETRRRFLGRMGKAFGWAGVAALLGGKLSGESGTAANPGEFHGPNFAPKAKRGIFLFMGGGPPQMDLWDYKPGLRKLYNQDVPQSVLGDQMLSGCSAGMAHYPIAPAYWGFVQRGKAGRWVSELLPWTGKLVDDIAIIRSLNTDAVNHEPAMLLMNTGNMVSGKPAMGAWLAYGLGSMNENLPTFIVLNSKEVPVPGQQPIYPRLWGSGFLPNQYGGILLRSSGEPVLYLDDPRGMTRETRRTVIDAVEAINRDTYHELGDHEIQTRISQYEMAFHMQTSVPELSNLKDEPAVTWDLYGPEAKEPGTFAYNCLMARRLAERGVRFTQIYQRGWDLHQDTVPSLPKLCAATDRACYALVTDLKQRGLLEDTLVIWAGEFGRTVFSQGGLSDNNYGRDHYIRCFTGWMAGGGVRPGIAYGETDDYCCNIVRDPVHVRDLDATILHLFGFDHDRLTFKYQGLEQKLTGTIPARVVDGLLA